METELSGKSTFYLAERRLVRETSQSYVFATSRSRNCEYITIPKDNKAVISVDKDSIRINEVAVRKAFKIEVKTWFFDMINIVEKAKMMTPGDVRIGL